MKTKLLALLLLFISVLNFTACDNEDLDLNLIVGKWTYFNDDPNLAVDGTVDYTFNADNTCIIYSSSFLSDGYSSTENCTYQLDKKENRLTIYRESTSPDLWVITKLNTNRLHMYMFSSSKIEEKFIRVVKN